MLSKLRKLDTRIGLVLWKDGSGFLRRFMANINLQVARWRSGEEKDIEIKKEVNSGAYELGQLCSPGKAEEIRENLEPRLDTEEAFVHESGGTDILRSISFDPEEIEAVNELIETPQLVKTVHKYFGSSFEVGVSRVLKYEYLSEEEYNSLDAYTRDWHLDTTAEPNAVRFLVFLSDQKQEGAFEVVPREQTEELLEEFEYDELNNDPSKVTRNAKIEKYTGDRGSGVLCDVVNQLHRGGGPSEGKSRMVLVFSFLPASE